MCWSEFDLDDECLRAHACPSVRRGNSVQAEGKWAMDWKRQSLARRLWKCYNSFQGGESQAWCEYSSMNKQTCPDWNMAMPVLHRGKFVCTAQFNHSKCSQTTSYYKNANQIIPSTKLQMKCTFYSIVPASSKMADCPDLLMTGEERLQFLFTHKLLHLAQFVLKAFHCLMRTLYLTKVVVW